MTISGASYGNGEYKVTTSVLANPGFSGSAIFDGVLTTSYYHTETGSQTISNPKNPLNVIIELPEPITVSNYKIYGRNVAFSELPGIYTFSGSVDGSSYTLLHDVLTVISGGSGIIFENSITNTTSYKYYKFSITHNQGNNQLLCVISEIQLITNPPEVFKLTFDGNTKLTLEIISRRGVQGRASQRRDAVEHFQRYRRRRRLS